MRKTALFVVLLLISAYSGPLAQTVDVPQWPDGSIGLNSGWRVHSGDNPAYAGPDFDDNQWRTVSLASQSDAPAGWQWYRLRVKLPTEHPSLALLVSGGDGTYEVYLNGNRLPGPKLKPPMLVTYPKERAIPLPQTGEEAEIALRTFVPGSSMFLADRGAWKVDLGTRAAIEHARRTANSDRVNQVVAAVAADLLTGLAGIAILALFWFERQHREYLWLGLFLVLLGTGTALFKMAAISSFLPFSVNWFLSDPSEYLFTIALIEFTFSFVGQRVNRIWRLYEGLLLVTCLLLLYPAWQGVITRAFVDVIEVLVFAPGAIGLPILLLVWFRRGRREAGWLILPMLLSTTALVFNDVAIVAGYFGWTTVNRLLSPPTVGQFTVQYFDIADLLFLLAIMIVIFFRFTRVNREQARSAAELDAARSVQSLLIPAEAPSTPGFAVESVYLPASEVGGDFFQIQPGEDGSLLLVVGDVSGKGLKAAMTVSAIVGALRGCTLRKPAEVLDYLNRVLHGQIKGFVTCAVALITADGAMTLANAGNLAPYLNGKELAVDSGLPLGILADGISEETRYQLAPGDRLTFVSDGVVEATNDKRELFGFDRTQAISNQPAQAIAEAARQFGQEDDISVLSVTRTPDMKAAIA